MAIKAKKKATIKSGISYTYDPKTFMEHMRVNFIEVKTAKEMLEKVQPFEYRGRKFIIFDTEDYYERSLKNHDVPGTVVRRWIGTGKKAVPVDFPFCISICDGKNCYTLYDTMENDYKELRALTPILEDITIEKVAHNTKFDMHMLANIGMKLCGKLHDTVVLAKLVDENRLSYKLWDIAEKMKEGVVVFEYMVDAYKKSHKITDYRDIPKELLTQYANADVWNCFIVFMSAYERLIADGLEDLYETELQLMIVLWMMERYGMKADLSYEEQLKSELQTLVTESERAVYEEAGQIFNMNSGRQIHSVLLKLGVDPGLFKMTDAGNACLDKNELKRLDEVCGIPLITKLLTYRQNEKLLNTYANGIYDQRDANCRVHGSINQTEATTGRMSIVKPALQTLPKKDKRIRRIFIPEEGYEYWFNDLDQVEYRMLGHYAKATGLIEAIKNGYDIHAATAALLFNVKIEEVTDEQRSAAKTVNFSFVYGQGDDATAAALKMTKSNAIRFKHRYFAAIPEVDPFLNQVKQVTYSRGYIRNMYGRRRRLRSNEVYKSPNALIQGNAADYIKAKIVLMFKFIMAHKYKTRLINVVHDEVISENHYSEQHILPKLRWLMSEFEQYRCPITAGVEKGNPSWGNKKEVTDEECGFEPLTTEEWDKVNNYNVFNGDVFELAKTL